MDQAEIVRQILSGLNAGYFKSWDFIISTGLSFLGLLFSFLAFIAARGAKLEAIKAGKVVRMQSVISDLNELSQKLDISNVEISYQEARNMINSHERKIRKCVAIFSEDEIYAKIVTNIEESLAVVKSALIDVRSTSAIDGPIKDAVYYAIEGPLAELSGNLSALIGLFESKTTTIIT